jgi:prepilin signal peptidase PulO-like enzyme (type II secretory pathway)
MEWMIGSIIFVLGLCIGSFLNVLIDRLPHDEDIFITRSHCDKCKRILRWYELIPVVSFLLQSGKCRRCHTPLSIQYPIIELITAFGCVYLFSMHLPLQRLIPMVIIYSSLVVLFMADIKYMILPDSMIITGIVGTILLLYGQPMGVIRYSLASAIGSVLVFFLLHIGTKGKGMGFGDVKLVGFLGLFLGYPLTMLYLYTAFLTGAFIGVILIVGKKVGAKSKIPFGPFLIGSALFVFLFRSEMLALWSHFF